VIAELLLENRLLKKRCAAEAGTEAYEDETRCSAGEKLEMLQLVWETNLSVRYTVRHIGISPSTHYNWLDRYEHGGFEGLEYRRPLARRIWNHLDTA
jgi:transposase-like protein